MKNPPIIYSLPFPVPIGTRFKPFEGCVVALGNFDGVHIGHKTVIDRTVQLARNCQALPALVTFEPHPNVFFAPKEPLFRLTSSAVKATIAQTRGCDLTMIFPFNEALASLNADDFLQNVLGSMLRVAGVVVGHDFHFGNQRTGTPDYLKKWCIARGIPAVVVEPVKTLSQVVSSTRIRNALKEGLIEDANQLLGHRWLISGTVQAGAQNGRELGFPTANIALGSECHLRFGVYAVRVRIEGDDRILLGAASYGRRPMYDNGVPLLEVFIMDFDSDIYGKNLTVEFVSFIRSEARFPDLNMMIAQMKRDIMDIRAALKFEDSVSLWD